MRIHFDHVGHSYLALFQVATFEGWMEVMEASIDAPLLVSLTDLYHLGKGHMSLGIRTSLHYESTNTSRLSTNTICGHWICLSQTKLWRPFMVFCSFIPKHSQKLDSTGISTLSFSSCLELSSHSISSLVSSLKTSTNWKRRYVYIPLMMTAHLY